MMRQRRHVNGNSNAITAVDAVASLGWGSGRTVPANITSTSKRVAPLVVYDDEVAPNTDRLEKRSGAATARRPPSSSLPDSRDPLAGCRPKRRVQSARGASDKCKLSSDAATSEESIGDLIDGKLRQTRLLATDNAKVEEDFVPVSDSDCVVSLLRAKYETRRVHQVFRDWDIDKNGGVTLAEIESNLRCQGLRIDKPQLTKLFDTYDLNHDGRLLYDEFMRLVYGPVHEQRYSYLADQRRKKQQGQQMDEGDPLDFLRSSAVPQQTNHSTDDPGFRATLQRKLKTYASRLNDTYAAFDDDHNGNLSHRELFHGLQELGLHLTEREFLHLAARVDTNGNGEISFKEFRDAFGGSSTPTGDEEDKRVEEQDKHSPETQANDSGQRRRATRTFNFSHLTRRTKIPTRCGRTPFPNTKAMISGNQDDGMLNPFTTEAQLYGSGSTSRPAPTIKVAMTLGQEEKQHRDAAKANRLQRLRVQMEHYDTQARPLQDSFNVVQERRERTLQRHQERYHQRIEEQRSRHALSPARKGIQTARPSPRAPFE